MMLSQVPYEKIKVGIKVHLHSDNVGSKITGCIVNKYGLDQFNIKWSDSTLLCGYSIVWSDYRVYKKSFFLRKPICF